MKFLDGFKTVIGLAGSVVLVLAPKVDPNVIATVGDHAYGIAQGVFGLLTIFGAIHKAEKRGLVG